MLSEETGVDWIYFNASTADLVRFLYSMKNSVVSLNQSSSYLLRSISYIDFISDDCILSDSPFILNASINWSLVGISWYLSQNSLTDKNISPKSSFLKKSFLQVSKYVEESIIYLKIIYANN